MRTELISAELYALPSLISPDSRKVYVACGEYVMSYSLKTGQLLEATDEILTKPTSLAIVNNKLAISDANGCRSFSNDFGSPLVSVSAFSIVAQSGSLTVLSSSPETLFYVVGDLSNPVVEIHSRGVFSRVSCSEKMVCAVIDGKTLFTYDIESGESRSDLKGSFTSTAVCDKEVVVGDSLGRIHRFPSNEMLHWHATPVSSLVFTSNGSVLLSGGEEGVVCMWTKNKSQPQCIPRLGGAIAHISLSGNQFACVSLETTNRIVIVDLFTRSVHSVISAIYSRPAVILETAENTILALDESRTEVEIFNLSTRREEMRCSLTDRNYLPPSLQKNSVPWTCKFLAVSQTTLCAAMQRHDQTMLKFYSVAGALESVCVLPNGEAIEGLCAIPTGFISLQKNGEVFQWTKKSAWEISRRISGPAECTFFGISHILFMAYSNVLTLWNPLTLTELTSSIVFSSRIVFAGIVNNSTNCFVAELDGQVSLVCLKKCATLASINLGHNIVSASIVAEKCMLQTAQKSLFSVVFSTDSLSVNHIELADSVDSVVSVGDSGLLVGVLGNTKFVRLDDRAARWENQALANDEKKTEEIRHKNTRKPKQIVQERKRAVLSMEEACSPEESFFMLIDQLAPKLMTVTV